jgi:hypothetical protein
MGARQAPHLTWALSIILWTATMSLSVSAITLMFDINISVMKCIVTTVRLLLVPIIIFTNAYFTSWRKSPSAILKPRATNTQQNALPAWNITSYTHMKNMWQPSEPDYN